MFYLLLLIKDSDSLTVALCALLKAHIWMCTGTKECWWQHTTHNAGRVRPQTSKSSTQQQAGSLNTSQSHKHRALVVRVNIYIFFSLVITQENSLCVRLVFSNSWFPGMNKLSTVMFIYKLHWISKALWNPLWLIMAELCVSVWSHAIFSFKISLKLIW